MDSGSADTSTGESEGKMHNQMSDKCYRFYQEYLSKGYDDARARHYAKQKAERRMIADLKANSPEVYAQIQEEVRREEERKQQAQLQLQREQYAAGQRRRHMSEYTRCAQVALTCTDVSVPPIAPTDFVSLRVWCLSDAGRLRGVGVGHDYLWQEVNFADKVPTERNGHGLYSIRIDPHGLLHGGAGNYLSGAKCVGLIRSGGKIIEHDDGVLRSEYARILCIWYLGGGAAAYVDIPALKELYPTTPVTVCNSRGVADVLFMIATGLSTLGTLTGFSLSRLVTLRNRYMQGGT